MEALLRPAFSVVSLPEKQTGMEAVFATFSPPGRGHFMRNSVCFTNGRRMSNLHDIHRRCNVKQSLEFSAFPDEKFPHEKCIFENELSKFENHYARLGKKLKAFYKFSRPYTMSATAGVTTSLCLLSLQSIGDLSPTFFTGYLKVLVVATLNIFYINGVNQLSDVEIDKINKPYLPLASGEFSTKDAMAFTLSATILSFSLAIIFKSPPLIWAAVISFLGGSAYSINLPFLRWKRYPSIYIPSQVLWCALGFQVPCYIHIQKYVFGRPTFITKSLIFHITMMSLLCIPQMILKDISDTDGDRTNGIRTISTLLGEERAFAIAIKIVLAELFLATVVGASSSLWFGKFITVFGNLGIAFALWNRSRYTDPTNSSSALSFYMFFYKALSIEQFLIHLVR